MLKFNQYLEEKFGDICPECLQDPCVCGGNHIAEEVQNHKVNVTVSDPNHQAVSQRKEKIAKRVIVKSHTKEGAVEKAKEFYKKKGYKVHDAEHHSIVPKSTMKTEETQLDEITSNTLQKYRQAAHTQIQHYKYASGKDKPEASKVLAKREPGMKRATDKVIKKEKERIAALPKREPEKHVPSYPLGGRDEKSGRSYSEEVVNEGAYEKAEENKRSADSAKKQGDMFAHHLHMADHHDNLAQWHDEKGRHGEADKHAKKSEEHHAQAMKLKEEVEQIDELSPETLDSYKKKAGEAASAADKKGDFEKGHKRFKGIMRATFKQFAADAKK